MLLPLVTLTGQELVRGPYLQSVAQESIKVLWRTNVPAESRVEISLTVGGDPVAVITDDSLVTDHIILIEGLQPATTYYYRIGLSDGFFTEAHERYRFTTSHQDTERIRFWATGDFGSKNQSQIDVRNAFQQYVRPDYPEFWLWLGDNVYDDGTDQEYQERIFTPPYGYDSLLTFLPFYAVPGNHDYNSVNRFSPPPQHKGPYFDVIEVPREGEAGGVPSNTELYYSFDYGNAHFAAVNSEAFQYTFFPNSVMEQWLREDLRQTDKMWKIVFWHQPPYSKGSHDSDDFWEVFMASMRNTYNPVAELYGADLVICGHSHVYERSHLLRGHYGKSGSFRPEMFIDNEPPYVKYIDGDSANYGTMYIVVGNSGKSEDEAEGGHPVFAFEDHGSGVCGSLLIEIDGPRLTGKYIGSTGEVRDEFTITKALRDSSVITAVPEPLTGDFRVYPNPATDVVNLEFSLKEPVSLSVSLYDLSGKRYLHEKASQYAAGKHSKRIALSGLNLASGQYIVKLEGDRDGRKWAQEQIVKFD